MPPARHQDVSKLGCDSHLFQSGFVRGVRTLLCCAWLKLLFQWSPNKPVQKKIGPQKKKRPKTPISEKKRGRKNPHTHTGPEKNPGRKQNRSPKKRRGRKPSLENNWAQKALVTKNPVWWRYFPSRCVRTEPECDSFTTRGDSTRLGGLPVSARVGGRSFLFWLDRHEKNARKVTTHSRQQHLQRNCLEFVKHTL